MLEYLHKALADCTASGGSIRMLDSQVEVHEVEVTDNDRNGDLNLLMKSLLNLLKFST